MRIQGTTFSDDAALSLKEMAVEACRAALRYDAAIREHANENRPWVESDQLDALKAQQVVKEAGNQ